LAEDRDLLKTILEETLQQVLEAEMDEALQASRASDSKPIGLPSRLLQPDAGGASRAWPIGIVLYRSAKSY
jgi:hypothetical protein